MQIIDSNNLFPAYSKKAKNEGFMTWTFPHALKCLKSNFYLVADESHYSNIVLDRILGYFQKRCGTLQLKMLPIGVLQAAVLP